MPVLEFYFSGENEPLKMHPYAYAFSEVVIDGDAVTDPCTVPVIGMSEDKGLTWLGVPFLRNFVVSYDYQNNEVTLG